MKHVTDNVSENMNINGMNRTATEIGGAREVYRANSPHNRTQFHPELCFTSVSKLFKMSTVAAAKFVNTGYVYWKAAGMSYLQYLSVGSRITRAVLKVFQHSILPLLVPGNSI